jgi:cell division cycle protein 20 (cofactor of APC complex)
LDAPGIQDDFYLSLLDWSTSNILAVGLGSSVYLWNASSGSVSELCSLVDDEPVASLSWSKDGTHLAIADFNGDTHLWDVENSSRLRTIRDHESRIGTLDWNMHCLSSGSRGGIIHNNDVRLARPRMASLRGHEGDVCGLKWASDGSQLASGGNDNLVNIWDVRQSTTARFTKRDHSAAVKVYTHFRIFQIIQRYMIYYIKY